MTGLVRPDLRHHPSWASAVREFGEDGTTMHGGGLWDLDTRDLGRDALATEVERLLAQSDPATELPDGIVPCSYYWIVEGEEFLGYLAVRHALNDWLHDYGGHLGYSVRPSRRGEGHAGRALALGLDQARAIGLHRVLITCDEDNLASRRTIESAGASYEDTRDVKRRYWFDLD
ncbi:GNAT family N-acetyltransferase [Nocardioides euryhalodurans]|uniref:GNAT family N-acetyltransferase n=1 Tax=Nocardioides euryhalodurans TaxID=2518370 RepID=A0A4P7GNA8_9ACTN|nr:GNAT family N-acetyltransferase [Nocardioides euryhalodurans]QBR93271.1 GNAT family N-acetyltransferase [Nocardioides euryhalodurans]